MYTRDYWPTDNWRVSKPSDQGMNTEILFNLYKYIQENNLLIHNLLIVKNGYVVSEGYYHPRTRDSLTQIYCITKPVIATLIHLLIKEGKIKSIDQKVAEFFDFKDIKDINGYKSEITIKHALTNLVGFEWGDTIVEPPSDLKIVSEMYYTEDWCKYIFNRESAYPPGTFFASTSTGSQILASLIKKITGTNAYEYAKEKLFKPLGIRDSLWLTGPTCENAGSQGLSLTSRDVAKLGLLYLSNGYWEDKSILDESWVKEATSIHCEVRDVHKRDFFIGHGYHWYIYTGLPYYTYCAYGMLGQFIIVAPDLDLVFVTSASLPADRHKLIVYDLFKNYVIPACQNPAKADANPEIEHQFQEFLYDIEYPEPKTNIIPSNNFIQELVDRKYGFDTENSFIFIENFFDKYRVKTLAFRFINARVCRLEIITYCNHFFNLIISLNSNFFTTKVMTEDGQMSISAKGIFENDHTFHITYQTNYGLRNSIKISFGDKNDKKYINCDVNNYFAQGIKKGDLINN